MAEVRFGGAVVYQLDGLRRTEVPGRTLRDLLEELEARFPPLAGRLIRDGRVSSLFLVYVEGVDSRLARGLDSEIRDGERVMIMNTLTGG